MLSGVFVCSDVDITDYTDYDAKDINTTEFLLTTAHQKQDFIQR